MRTLLLLIGAALTVGMTPCLAQEAAPVTIGGVTYDTIDPGNPFTKAARPPQDWEAPAASKAEQAAGMMAYVTPDPGDYKPDRIPRDREHITSLFSFLTPGEDEPVTFGVYSLAEINGLSVRVDTGEAPVTVDVRHEHFWPQRTGWRSRQWYITPELLLPCADGKRTVPAKRGVLAEQAFDLAANETAAFWLTLTTESDAKPGLYDGAVIVAGEGRPELRLPLQIEVLPFTLQKPADRSWLLYCDQARWRNMSTQQVEAELRDFARHGVNGLVEMPLGSLDLSEIASGKAKFDATRFEELTALCAKAGLEGPHVCSLGGMPERVRAALGVDCDLRKDTWPQAIKDGVEAVGRAAVEATADTGARWYFYGVDEPRGDNTYAIQDYQAWRRGGAETYATFYNISFLDKASEFLTAPCFVVGLVSSERTARAAREACERTGAEFWWYGTGSYVNPFPQEGYMFHNRYGAGFLFWKTGARASVAWTFCRPHEDVFNDFDGSRVNSAEPKEQVTAYPHFLKPDDWSTYQGAIPTIAWESMREGVDDYGYLTTLKSLIDEAAKSDKAAVRDAGAAAEESMTELVDGMPWANPMGGVAFETRRMQQVRRSVAELILDLQAAIDGKPRKTSQSRQTSFSLDVSVLEADQAATDTPPVMPIVTTQKPPEIDGRLDDDCWKEGAVAGAFRGGGKGLPAVAPTEGRIVCDDEAVYVAFDCAEALMDKLVAKQQGHDTPMVWLDDGIEFFLAGAQRSTYAHIIVNTNGSVYDEAQQNPAWDPNIEVAVGKRDDGWSVEMGIPWVDLEGAGVGRSSVMALNFCRNRFAGGEKNAHTAWSCTFGGFHVPQRFGVGLVQQGRVMLTDLQLPALWGRQSVQVGLRNATDAPLTAEIRAGRRASRQILLPPAKTVAVSLPIKLFKPGSRSIPLAWGIAGEPLQEMTVMTQIPAPLTGTAPVGFVSPGDAIEMPVRINVTPGDRERYSLALRVTSDGQTRTFVLPLKPGQRKSIAVRTSGKVRAEASLVNVAGRSVGDALGGTLFPLP